jgi:hypothetical protein
LDLDSDRNLLTFNLDGFSKDDKSLLIGLIQLSLQGLYGRARPGRTLLVYDEVHLFTVNDDGSASAVGQMLVRDQRITRKHDAAQVLASQEPGDYAALPGLLENAAHHVLMRAGASDPPRGWKVRDPELLTRARSCPPAKHAGFSGVHLAAGTATGERQIGGRLILPPAATYLLTSGKRDKAVLRLAMTLTGSLDPFELADRVHAESEDRKLVPIGSEAFWRALAPYAQPQFAALFEDLRRLTARVEDLLAAQRDGRLIEAVEEFAS